MAVKSKRAHAAPPPKPQFFKILLPGFERGLKIPQQFNEHIVRENPRKATILSPLGKSWLVDVHRATNFLYLGKGWQEFSEAHELHVGYLVLFRYEGEMVFAVTIFDRTACMKEYIPAGGGNKVDDDFYSPVRQNPSGCPRQQGYFHDQSLTEMLDRTDSQNHNANFASSRTDGSQFEIKINSYNPTEEPNLPLPQAFIKYLSGKNSTWATLLSPSGESWRIRIHEDRKGFHFGDGWQRFAVTHSLRRGDSVVLKHKGALIFVIAIFNDSICKPAHNLVEVCGAGSVSIPTRKEKSEKGLAKLPASFHGARTCEAMEPTTGNQKFEVVLSLKRQCKYRLVAVSLCITVVGRQKLCNVLQMQEIPANFAASNGLRSIKQLFLRDPNGCLWPASLSHRENRRSATVHVGWRDFFVGNDLKDGDVCSFELNKEKNELHVEIRRGTCQKSMKVLKDTNRKLEGHLYGRTAAELVKTETYRRVGRLARINHRKQVSKVLVDTCNIPGSSQFTRTISRSNLLRRARLVIPRPFLSSVDLTSVRRMFLLDQKTRRWPVNVNRWLERMKYRVTIGAGWKAFCVGNNVEVGDECVFRLASSMRNDVFRVSIIKRKMATHDLHVSGFNRRRDSTVNASC